MLNLAVLGSGSSGNSALVCLGETRILIDAGLSARQLRARLESLGIDPGSLAAIVLTHEHGDHARGIDVFCRKQPVPVFATAHTGALVRETVRGELPWRHFEAGASFRIGGIEVESFPVPHDAVDPVGFVFRCGRSSLGVVSDLGHVTRVVAERLKGVDTLFAEANYDETLLMNDTRRPWATKQRISNRHGHLSNGQAAELVARVAAPNLSRVVLGHLSSDCNTPELARESVASALRDTPAAGAAVECAGRDIPLPLRPVASPPGKTAPGAPVPRERAAAVREPAPAAEAAEAAVHGPAGPADARPGPAWRQSEWAF